MRKAAYSLARHCPGTPRRCLHQLPNDEVLHRTTVLPNKLRVVTDRTPGHFSSIGLFVDAGSKYETEENLGSHHFIDRLSFQSTSNRTSEQMLGEVSSLSGEILCASFRESISYLSSHFPKETPKAIGLIADTVLNPLFTTEEVEGQRDAASYELRQSSSKPELYIPEVLHAVAYNNRGLGNPLLCPEERIPLITGSMLKKTMRERYRPERMVVAGSGMPHEQLVELVDKHFSSLAYEPQSLPMSPRTQSQPATNILSSIPPPPLQRTLTRAASYLFPQSQTQPPAPMPITDYTGGHKYIFDADAEFNHLYVAFEGVGVEDDDVYTLAVMQVLLGGGGSFSAGGPGKGMYSRLYTHILNRFPQVDHCAAFHHIYINSALFGLFASFVPASAGLRGGNTPSQIMHYLIHQLSLLLYTAIPAVELQRAKNQLKSSLIMSLESPSVQVEDLGRQILLNNRVIPLAEMSAKIDAITSNDIRTAANRIFGPNSGRKPTIVCMGPEDIGEWVSTFSKYGVSA